MRSLILLSVVLCGCLNAQEKNPTPVEPIFRPEPLVKPDNLPDQSIKIEAPQHLIAALHDLLGDDNEIEFVLTKPIVVSRPAGKITIPSGAKISYSLSDSQGSFEFSGRRPVLEAKIFGLKISPSLQRILLKPDNTGEATVIAAGLSLTKRFKLDWEDESVKSAVIEKPKVYFYTTIACAPCEQAKKELQGLDLPFEIVILETAPAWVTLFPTFHWLGADGKSWFVTGWSSVDSLKTSWAGTQAKMRVE
ncbi:MAG: hypothetical protein ACKO0Z_18220 [Betaproteobacteria bacterium]